MKSHLFTRGLSLALLAVLALPSAAMAEDEELTHTQAAPSEARVPAPQAPAPSRPAPQAPAQQVPAQEQVPAPAPAPVPAPAPAPMPAPAPAPMPVPAPAPAPTAPTQEVKPEAPKRVRKWGFLRLRRRESGEIQGERGGAGGGMKR